MDEDAASSTASAKSDYFGIAALLLAILMFLAIADLPNGYHQAFRFLGCLFSIAVAYREWGSRGRGWLLFAGIGAFLFNPIFVIGLGKGDWQFADLIFGVGFGAYGISLLSKAIAKLASIAMAATLVGALALAFYVNHYMPHGATHATGDIACQSDDRGPCGEERKEDLSQLDIPEWAKFVREYFVGALLLLGSGAAYSLSVSRENRLEI